MKTSLPAEVLRALRATLVIAVIGGLVYPLVMTGLAQGLFHDQANGGLITAGSKVIGAKLIGQNFTSDKYFNGRPSATVDENDRRSRSRTTPQTPPVTTTAPATRR
jgi:potassium-transporting ATPase KdpC subunit